MSELAKNSPKAEKENGGLIIRRAALDALDGELEVTGEENAIAVVNYLNAVRERIKCLPAAGSMWIPVSERLPENDDHVLCTTVKKDGTAQVVRGYYDPAYRRWVSGMNSNIIAWMPLPEPYAERREDGSGD